MFTVGVKQQCDNNLHEICETSNILANVLRIKNMISTDLPHPLNTDDRHVRRWTSSFYIKFDAAIQLCACEYGECNVYVFSHQVYQARPETA